MTTTRYKLTDENDQTRGGCQWGEGIGHETNGEGNLCGPGWLHVYTDPLLTVMLNPLHREDDLDTAHLWEVECEGQRREDLGLKEGWTKVQAVRRMDMPQVSREQRIRFGILCAWEVYRDIVWRAWAKAWLDGARRRGAAQMAAEAAAAAEAGAAEAAAGAAWAATGAAKAAESVGGSLNLIALAHEAMTEATRTL